MILVMWRDEHGNYCQEETTDHLQAARVMSAVELAVDLVPESWSWSTDREHDSVMRVRNGREFADNGLPTYSTVKAKY